LKNSTKNIFRSEKILLSFSHLVFAVFFALSMQVLMTIDPLLMSRRNQFEYKKRNVPYANVAGSAAKKQKPQAHCYCCSGCCYVSFREELPQFALLRRVGSYK
jgi:hypothetical protein